MRPALPALVACLVLASLASAQAVRDARVPVPSSCDVRDHGATGVRAHNATAAVQQAVDACHAAGGGTVFIPPGEYTTGTIVLKDNVTLWLEAGSVLYLSQDPADFPRERAHVFAENARNVAIRVLGNDFTATDTPVGLADEGLRSELALEGNLVRR